MRLGCMLLIVAVIAVCGLTAGAVWVGLRMVEEPEVAVAPGTPEDGIRSQQKIYEIVGAVPGRGKGRPRQIILSEPELNAFLSRHLGEASKFPFGAATVRLVGEGLIEFKGQLPLRRVLAALLNQLRWRIPETVEAITIETRMVVIRTAS